MSHTILITGASGYLGGSLLSQLSSATLPPHKKLYALVRSQEQAEAVKQYGAEPFFLNLGDEDSLFESIVDAKISIIYYLIDAVKSDHQIPMIKALAEVKKQTGQDVHFLHTSGAKIFSQHAGMPTDRKISDADPGLYELQKASKPPHAFMATAIETNNSIIETAEAYGVRSYIFIPCIVYGKGAGFGNKISIQTAAVIRAARAVRAAYDPNSERATWPVCHIHDNSTLYVDLLHHILSDRSPGYGKDGYYLAASGSVAWFDIYTAIAKALAKQGAVDAESVTRADDVALEKMGKALKCPKELVAVQLGGVCTLSADRAGRIGWKPQYTSEHIFEAAEAEVDFFLKNLEEIEKL